MDSILEAKILRVKEISDQVATLSDEKRRLVEELAVSGFEKDKVQVNDTTFTVSLEDHQQEGGSAYGGFVFISRYGLRFYENKKKEKKDE